MDTQAELLLLMYRININGQDLIHIFGHFLCLLVIKQETKTFRKMALIPSSGERIKPYLLEPNVVVEWLGLQFRIWEVPGSNLARKPALMTDMFRGFSHSFQENIGIVPKIRPRPLLPCSVSSLAATHPLILRYRPIY
jgi:hypothetical protein